MRRENTKLKNFCTFYIVRHGQTEWNAQGKLQGQQDSPLTSVGITQAKKTAVLLKHIPFAEAFSSDLLRARRTAEIITVERNLALKTSQLLRERSYGAYEGKTRRELEKLFLAYETLSAQERFKKGFAEGVESDERLSARFITFLREAAVVYSNKNILVVSHGGAIRSLLLHLGFNTSGTPHFWIKNAAIVILLSDGVEFFVKKTSGVGIKNS